MGAVAETHSQHLVVRAYIEDLHHVSALGTMEPHRRGGRRIVGARGFTNIRRTWPKEPTKQASQRLKQQSHSLHGSALGLLHIGYGCYLSVFVKLLWERKVL